MISRGSDVKFIKDFYNGVIYYLDELQLVLQIFF